MPIYEYRCSQCGHELESLQKLRDDPLKDCPACGAATLIKKVSAAGFQLKGTGWYATDFRNGSKPAAAKKDGDAPAAEAKSQAGAPNKGETARAKRRPGDTKPPKTAATPAAAAPASSAGTGTPST